MSTTKPEVVYVTNLAVSGFLNGVCNLGFSVAHFLPVQDGDKVRVDAAEEMAANIRFDLLVAQQVYEALGKIIDDNTKPKAMNS